MTAASAMGRGRLEAFSDGVMAIIVTITVLGLKPPVTERLPALVAVWPTFAAYGVSFVFVAIIWVNHHALVQSARKVDALVLWTNMAMLFAMSLIPFATTYLAEHLRSALPVALYATLFAACLSGFMALSAAIARHRLPRDDIARSRDAAANRKNLLSVAAYLAAIPVAFVSTWTSLAIAVAVSALFILPVTWPAAAKS